MDKQFLPHTFEIITVEKNAPIPPQFIDNPNVLAIVPAGFNLNTISNEYRLDNN